MVLNDKDKQIEELRMKCEEIETKCESLQNMVKKSSDEIDLIKKLKEALEVSIIFISLDNLSLSGKFCLYLGFSS